MALSYDSLKAYMEGLYTDGLMSAEDFNKIIVYILANGNIEQSPRDLLQIRRGNVENLPNLAQGEMGIALDEERFYIGGVSGNIGIPNKKDLDDIAISVKKYGAKGDGVTDDTIALQNVIDYAFNNNIFNVFFPIGTYITTKPLIIKEKMILRGENRESTSIKKITNTVSDNPNYNTIDAVIILDKSENYSRSYTERQHIKGIGILGNRSVYNVDNTQYGVYSSYSAPFFTAENFRVANVDIGIYLNSSWHSTFTNGLITAYKRVLYINTESQGIRINNLDCFGSNEVCIEFSGSNYGSISTLNMEYIKGTGLKVNFSSIVIIGMAVEWSTDDVNKCLHLVNSRVILHNSFFNTNKVDTTYRTFYLQGSKLEVNGSSIGYPDTGLTVKGRLFEMTTGNHIKLSDDNKIYCTFEENSVIGDTSNTIEWNKVKQIQRNILLGEFKRGSTFVDDIVNPNPSYVNKKIMLDNKYDPLYSENDPNDRGYTDAYNKGDWALINNPLKNGHGAYIATRNNKTSNTLMGTIVSVEESAIVVSDLTLDNFATEGGRLYRNLGITTSSGGVASISTVDYTNNRITLSNKTGTWNVGDTITTNTNAFLRNSQWGVVPIINSGATSQRPTSPIVGQEYFDVQLGKPIWCKQVVPSIIWVDSAGSAI